MPPAEKYDAAVKYYRDGRYAEAARLCAELVLLEPSNPGAFHLAGLIALRQGDGPAATQLLAKAVSLSLTDPEHWHNLGVAMAVVGQFPEAAEALERAISLQPEYAKAYLSLGPILAHLGRTDQAVEALQKGARLSPSVEAYQRLGDVYLSKGNNAEAAAVFEKALRLDPNHPESLHGLGVARHNVRDLEGATALYRRALAARPAYAAASNSLATAFKELGDLDVALEQFRHSLRIQPNYALTLYSLAQFATEGRYEFPASDLERIRARLATGRGPAPERCLLAFAAGWVLDRQGMTTQAFDYIQLANDLNRRAAIEKGTAFDPARFRGLVDATIACYSSDYFLRTRGWGVESERPIFIVGMPRSGSTVVEQILGTDPQVFGAEEIGAIPRLALRLVPPDPAEVQSPAAAAETAAQYLEMLTAVAGAAPRVTDKTLENVLHLGLIATLFPRCRIIHCRRQPGDVAVSCFFQNFHDITFASSLEDLADYYRGYDRLMRYWAEVLPVPVHEVVYEELVSEPERVTRTLFEYCGLIWHTRCLDFASNHRPVRTASSLQVRKPLSTASVGRWQRYEKQLAPFFTRLNLPW